VSYAVSVGLGVQRKPKIKVRPEGKLAANRRRYDEKRRRSEKSRDTLRYMELLRTDPCVFCGALPETGRVQDVDHIVPLDAGGLDDWTNMAAACAPCNRGRRNRDLLDTLTRRRDRC
jgi:5-methylcytosine-specific restriction endonuclease McrA